MSIPLKPVGMDRREFLQFAGSGLLLSMLATRTTRAVAGEDVTFALRTGFRSLYISQPGVLRNSARCATQIRALNGPVRKPRSNRCSRQLGDLPRDGLPRPARALTMLPVIASNLFLRPSNRVQCEHCAASLYRLSYSGISS